MFSKFRRLDVLFDGLHGRAQISSTGRHRSSASHGVQRDSHADADLWRLETCPAARRHAPRQVVGDFQRCGIKFARRSAEHQQPEHQAGFRKFHGGPHADRPGALATLSHAKRGAHVLLFASLGESQEYDRYHRCGGHIEHKLPSKQRTRHSPLFRFLGAGSMGQSSQHHS